MLSKNITIKDLDFKQKRANDCPVRQTRQVCHVLPRELFLLFKNVLEIALNWYPLLSDNNQFKNNSGPIDWNKLQYM